MLHLLRFLALFLRREQAFVRELRVVAIPLELAVGLVSVRELELAMVVEGG